MPTSRSLQYQVNNEVDLIIQMSFSDDLVEIVSGWNQKMKV